MSTPILILLHAAVLAYAFVGGAFLAFSDFIMRSLAKTSGAGGVEAMQSINREVFRWVFMTLFLGMAAGSVALIALGVLGVEGPGSVAVILAGAVYLIGCFGVTVLCNVPMNEALDKMETSSEEAWDYWLQIYLPRWTFWNSVRTVACAVSAALLLVGLDQMG